MPAQVDLTAMPYNLDESRIQWVEDTIASMTDEERVGQLSLPNSRPRPRAQASPPERNRPGPQS